jgi:hypothetical protein
MVTACATRIPVPRLPAHVFVLRGRSPLRGAKAGQRLFLKVGDRIRVSGQGRFTFTYSRNRFTFVHGQVSLSCRKLAIASKPTGAPTTALSVALQSGRVEVRVGPHSRRALVISPEMLAFATASATTFVVERNRSARATRAWTRNQPIISAMASDQKLRINARATYTAISDSKGLRLDVWPFSISVRQRLAAPALPPFWADPLPCSVGCTAPGVPGWPLKPFHQQHAIRAGINELRPANFHVGVDIEAHDFQPVYAIESGQASIRYRGTGDVNVDIGRFYYWHIAPTVTNGQRVVAYKTEIGRVLNGFGHIALSEGTSADYLNPLRPGGSLRPYHDSEPPIIGVPRVFSDGRVIVGAFDPQSFIAEHQSYATPVLAPSSLAWRLYDAHGRALTGLQWAMRGSQDYPPSMKRLIFAPGASNPGFECFLRKRRCIPNWVYWLAGGLTEPLPLSSLSPGRYRLAVYAWDWAGNTSALDSWITLPLGRAAGPPSAEFGPLAANFDYP